MWWVPQEAPNSEGLDGFRDMLGRTLHGTVGGNTVVDLGRFLSACLPNQGFSTPVSTLLHVFHFPNCIFFFQMNKLSVLFNVVELKMLFHYPEYSLFPAYLFLPFCLSKDGSDLNFYIPATILAPLKVFLSLSVSQWLWKSYVT